MSIVLDGTTGITTPGLTNTGTETIVNLTTTGNTILGDASTDTLNVGNGGLVKDASGNVGIGTASPSVKLDIVGANNGSQLRFGNGRLYTYSTSSSGGYDNSLLTLDSNSSVSQYAWSVGGSEKVRIDSSGNVGVGTSSPNAPFEVSRTFASSAIEEVARFSRIGASPSSSNRAAAISFYDANNGTLTAAVAGVRQNSNNDFNGALAFYTNNTGVNVATAVSQLTERMRIDSSGNLLVGQTSAGILGGSIGTSIEASGLNNARITINHSSSGSSNGSYFMQFAYAGVLSGGITQASTTTVGFYSGPSDRRLKNNIEDLDSSGEFIDALRPRKWTWIKSGEADSGFVADELQTVISCCVNGEADAVDEDGKPVYQMVDASPPEMIANIVAELKAIRKREKEQQALITSLTSRITELEAK